MTKKFQNNNLFYLDVDEEKQNELAPLFTEMFNKFKPHGQNKKLYEEIENDNFEIIYNRVSKIWNDRLEDFKFVDDEEKKKCFFEFLKQYKIIPNFNKDKDCVDQFVKWKIVQESDPSSWVEVSNEEYEKYFEYII